MKDNLLSMKNMGINEGDGGYSEDRSVSARTRVKDVDGRGEKRARARARKRWDEICLYVADTAAVYLLVGSGDKRESWKFSHPKLDGGERGDTRWERYKSVSSVLCQIRSSCL